MGKEIKWNKLDFCTELHERVRTNLEDSSELCRDFWKGGDAPKFNFFNISLKF